MKGLCVLGASHSSTAGVFGIHGALSGNQVMQRFGWLPESQAPSGISYSREVPGRTWCFSAPSREGV